METERMMKRYAAVTDETLRAAAEAVGPLADRRAEYLTRMDKRGGERPD